MLTKLKNTKGFTIIEVMIVLAIAGLIMLIVFLAVPALQRNAHNTSAKNDAAAVMAAVNEYVNNNNGTLPDKATVAGNVVTISDNAGTGNSATAKIGYYTKVTFGTDMPGAPDDGIVIVKAAKCDGNDKTAGTARSYVALYRLEGNPSPKQCTEA